MGMACPGVWVRKGDNGKRLLALVFGIRDRSRNSLSHAPTCSRPRSAAGRAAPFGSSRCRSHDHRYPHCESTKYIGVRRIMRDHSLVVITLLLAYFAVNVLLAVRVRVFTMARSRKLALVIYSVAFLVWGSFIMLGVGMIEIMRRLDDEAA